MAKGCYNLVKDFIDKYPYGICWRIKKHCKIVDMHLNPNEEIQFACCGQLNNEPWGLIDSAILAITNERIIIGHKKIMPGYKFVSITPDLYNDMSVVSSIFWGTIVIDTVKEIVYLSNLDKKCLPEVETKVTTFMMDMKKKYPKEEEEKGKDSK